MKLMKLCSFFLAAWLGAAVGNAGAAGLTVTPAAVSNQYSGPLTVQITGVPNGATVVVRMFRDFNGNGAVDAGADVLIKQFTLTDGTIPTIGGRTNANVPADLDGAVNGAITVPLDFRNVGGMDHVAGKYIFQVTSPTSAFVPVLAPFTVTATAFPQSVTGTVTGASNCVVVLVNPARPAEVIVGTTAAANGGYTLPCPVGRFALVALQAGSVTDLANAPQLTVGAAQTVPQDLSFLNSDRTISGTLLDGPGGAPLPGVPVSAQSSGGNLVQGFTDATGGFNLKVLGDTWNLDFSAAELARRGCLSFHQPVVIDATGGSVLGSDVAVVRATSLIYGRVIDETSQPVVGAYLTGLDITTYTYATVGTTDANGNYTLGVTEGDWFVEPRADRLGVLGYLGRTAVVTATAAAATAQDLNVRRVTAVVKGRLVDDGGIPVPALTLVATETTFNFRKQVVSGPDGTFEFGLFGGSWSVTCDEFEAEMRGLLAPRLTVAVQDNVNQNGVELLFRSATVIISGTVTNAAGAPITSIYVSGSLTAGATTYQTSGFTLDDGTYSFRVAPGNWQFSLSPLADQGYQNPAPQDVVVTGDTVVNWSVTTAPPTPPTLTIRLVAGGRFQLTLTGQGNTQYTIDFASSLTNVVWTPLLTNTTDPAGVLVQEDTPPAGLPRFYRARLTP